MRRSASVPPVSRTAPSLAAHASRARAATCSRSIAGTSASRFARAPAAETSEIPTASSKSPAPTSAAPTPVPLADAAPDGALPADHTACDAHGARARTTK